MATVGFNGVALAIVDHPDGEVDRRAGLAFKPMTTCACSLPRPSASYPRVSAGLMLPPRSDGDAHFVDRRPDFTERPVADPSRCVLEARLLRKISALYKASAMPVCGSGQGIVRWRADGLGEARDIEAYLRIADLGPSDSVRRCGGNDAAGRPRQQNSDVGVRSRVRILVGGRHTTIDAYRKVFQLVHTNQGAPADMFERACRRVAVTALELCRVTVSSSHRPPHRWVRSRQCSRALGS